MTPSQQADAQLSRLEVWIYRQMGRVFIIDKANGEDNNVMNAVAEIILPGEARIRPEKGEHPQAFKDRIVAMKLPIAAAMDRAFQITAAYDKGDLGQG